MHTEFFLGANSGLGFYSLYHEFCRNIGDTLYLIKGGPGGGKSSFMRRIAGEAEKRGLYVEYILCSGDPDSLDGVYIPALHIGLADATSPHVIEPQIFGLDSCYVNLGQFCSSSSDLRIKEYTEKYKAMYNTAYSYLAAAKQLKDSEIPNLITQNEINMSKKRAQSALRRELGSCHDNGRITRRFIRCISCKGEIVLQNSIFKLCKLAYKLDDRFGLEQYYMSEVIKGCEERSINTIICPSPLCPDKTDAVLIPEKSLAFVAASLTDESKPWRHVRLDALIPNEHIKTRKSEIRRREKLLSSIIHEAYYYLSEAKRYHDLLEEQYNPLVDFDALNKFKDEFINKLFN